MGSVINALIERLLFLLLVPAEDHGPGGETVQHDRAG